MYPIAIGLIAGLILFALFGTGQAGPRLRHGSKLPHATHAGQEIDFLNQAGEKRLQPLYKKLQTDSEALLDIFFGWDEDELSALDHGDRKAYAMLGALKSGKRTFLLDWAEDGEVAFGEIATLIKNQKPSLSIEANKDEILDYCDKNASGRGTYIPLLITRINEFIADKGVSVLVLVDGSDCYYPIVLDADMANRWLDVTFGNKISLERIM